jgi:hypothetical protein
MSRAELIFKMRDGKAITVVEVQDMLEQKWGELFYQIGRISSFQNLMEGELGVCKGNRIG